METVNWHMLYQEGTLTLARRLPARFDVSVETTLPSARKGRLAHQIRQDLWRMLRHLRGFSPVVRVVEDGPHLRLAAGGTVATRSFPKAKIEAQIADLLACPKHRTRWLNNARLKVPHA